MRFLLGLALILAAACGGGDSDEVGPFSITIVGLDGDPLPGWQVTAHDRYGMLISDLRSDEDGRVEIDEYEVVTVGSATEFVQSRWLTSYMDVPEGTELVIRASVSNVSLGLTEVALPFATSDRGVRVFDNCNDSGWQEYRPDWQVTTYETCAPTHGGLDVAAISWSTTAEDPQVTVAHRSEIGGRLVMPAWQPAARTDVDVVGAPDGGELFTGINLLEFDAPRWYFGDRAGNPVYHAPAAGDWWVVLAAQSSGGDVPTTWTEVGTYVDRPEPTMQLDFADRLPMPIEMHLDTASRSVTWTDDGQGSGVPLDTLVTLEDTNPSGLRWWYFRARPDRTYLPIPRDLISDLAVFDTVIVQDMLHPQDSFRDFLEYSWTHDAPLYGRPWASSYNACPASACVD